ncbi:MAG: hypothetical protein ACTHN0_14220 [Aquihabitans sp.]
MPNITIRDVSEPVRRKLVAVTYDRAMAEARGVRCDVFLLEG